MGLFGLSRSQGRSPTFTQGGHSVDFQAEAIEVGISERNRDETLQFQRNAAGG